MAYKVSKIAASSGQTVLTGTPILMGVTVLSLFFASSCASTKATNSDRQPVPSNTADDRQVSEVRGGFTPACLNIVENEMRIEFDKSKLIFQDGATTSELSLDGGENVQCEKLNRLEDTKNKSVEIIYLTRGEDGVRTENVWERKHALASLATGHWIAKPVVVDRLFRDGSEIKTVALRDVKWSKDRGDLVLTRVDLKSKTRETVRP